MRQLFLERQSTALGTHRHAPPTASQGATLLKSEVILTGNAIGHLKLAHSLYYLKTLDRINVAGDFSGFKP